VIEVDEVKGNIPKLPVMPVLDQGSCPLQLDDARFDQPVLIRLEVLDILPDFQRVFDFS